jgi:hypothetical protein
MQLVARFKTSGDLGSMARGPNWDESCVWTVLLCGAETWKTNKRIEGMLGIFEGRLLTVPEIPLGKQN